MITHLALRNFRGFRDHTLPLADLTLIVGANNAGKSTIVEALRLVAIVVTRYRSLAFRPPPSWLSESEAAPGVSPSLDGTGIDLSTVMYQYEDPPASVRATFASGATVVVLVGPDGEIHAVIRANDGALVIDRAHAYRVALDTVASQPQVAPLVRNEVLLMRDTVVRNLSSTLAPSHFRNQLHYLDEYVTDLRTLAEETWPGFMLKDLVVEGELIHPPQYLRLFVRNKAFVGEIASMGHGLQMWLQTLWFLVRNPDASTVILDEPDVYLHSDLQHKLMRLLRRRYPQLIVATHSAEMMSEVEPQQILIVDSERRDSRFANTPEGVQEAIDRMGGIHNLQLARLAKSERCLLLEGQDIEILKRMQAACDPDTSDPLTALPQMEIGGWSGWQYAVGSSMFLRNAAGQQIRVYCILDSDYHTPDQIEQRKADAVAKHVDLHIWRRKELENYLLVPETLTRVIAGRVSRRTEPPTLDEVRAKVVGIAESFHDAVTDSYANEFLAEDRAGGLQKANRAARALVAAAWESDEGRVARAPGKEVLARLSEWSQAEFGVSFGATTIAAEMAGREVPDEVRQVMKAVEERRAL